MATTTKTDIPQIYPSMAAVMAEIEAIGKTQKNRDQGFMFRGIDDLYNAIHDLMAKHQIVTIPVENELLQRYDRPTRSGGSMTYTLCRIKYAFVSGIDGSVHIGEVIGEGADTGDKSTNKAMAVGHKYLLLQTFLVATKDMEDPDASAHENQFAGGNPYQQFAPGQMPPQFHPQMPPGAPQMPPQGTAVPPPGFRQPTTATPPPMPPAATTAVPPGNVTAFPQAPPPAQVPPPVSPQVQGSQSAPEPPAPEPTPEPPAAPATTKKVAKKKATRKKADDPAQPEPAGDTSDDLMIEDEDGAKFVADSLIATVDMHCGSKKALQDFWRKNAKVIDLLDSKFNAEYQRVKEVFTQHRNRLEEAK